MQAPAAGRLLVSDKESGAMPKVLIADEMSEVAAQAFAEHGIEAEARPGLPPEALAGIIEGYEGLAIRSATRVTAALLERASRLKVVGRAGTGVDNVDLEAGDRARHRGHEHAARKLRHRGRAHPSP